MRPTIAVFRRGISAAAMAGALLASLIAPAVSQPAAAPQPAPLQPAAPAMGPVSQEYTISPGDVLDVSVLGEPAVGGPVMVSPDGSIMMQLAGRVQAAGLTLPQLTDRIAAALRKYIRSPQVVVSISQTAQHRQFVYLVGQVNRPGAYEVQTGWTVAALLAAAGGAAPGASLPKAFILRQNARIPIDLKQVLVDGNTSANLALEPGDVVIVPEAQERVLLMGQVAKPGQYLFKPGDHLIDLLSAGGGPSQGAAINNIGIIRQVGQKPTVTPVNLDRFYRSGDLSQNVALEPGDIVYVPQRSGVSWASVLGTLGNLGWLVYLLK
jgi:polysaccharide export outer membrane protein